MNYTYSDELFSDLHKDAYGCRPGIGERLYWQTLTADEKQAEWDRLCDMLEANEVRRKEMEGAAWRRFLRDVAYNLQHGAADERTAVRWILDAHDLSREHDTGYICYCLGLSYDKAPLFEDYVVEYFGEKEVDFA